MQFTSVSFLLFAAALLIVYYLIPGRWQWVLLLAAGGIFYLCAGVEYLVFLALTMATTYVTARIMDRNRHCLELPQNTDTPQPMKARRARVKQVNRRWLAACLGVNFAVLFFCKACLVEPLYSAAQSGRISFLTLGLPLGISFYMFQSMGYIIDVYRGKCAAQRNFAKLALFISYFPQLIQGPISRYDSLAPQLTASHPLDGKQVSFGLQRMLWGYFKKLVVADRIAVAVAALKGAEYTGTSFLVLTCFYAIQIYGDFTGGIDIAIGLSQALGITLTENFVRPFFSKNIAEYWRRWHISLGDWMKDYIFYPISVSKPMLRLSKKARAKLGNFGRRLPVYAASIATWFCTGIWHGLSPNFVVWGMLNCLVIVVSEELTPLYQRFHARFHLKEKKWYGGFEILRMFWLMNLIRIVDLFPHVGDYFSRIGSLFTVWNPHILWDGTLMRLGLTGLDYGILLFAVALMFTVSLVQEKKGSVRELLWGGNAAVRYGLIFLLLTAVLLLGSYGVGYDASSFIYNQF